MSERGEGREGEKEARFNPQRFARLQPTLVPIDYLDSEDQWHLLG